MNATIEQIAPAPAPAAARAEGATFIVFSGDLDRLLAAFTLANASAAGGVPTTMFFTFWSIAALRTPAKVKGKNLIEKMFGWMLPRGPAALPLSKMQFCGLGPRLIGWRMRKKNVAELTTLIDAAEALGVRMLACEASMDLLGLRLGELRPGVQIAGAAACVEAAMRSKLAMMV